MTEISSTSAISSTLMSPNISGASYEEVISGVEKNMNVDELRGDLRIEFIKGQAVKSWTARMYFFAEGGVNWKVAKFYGSRENGTVIRKIGEGFSQTNGGMPYFPLGSGAAEAGIFGTDYSFKDILEFTKLLSDYNRQEFRATDGGYLVKMKSKPGGKPYYYSREMLVDRNGLYPKWIKVYGASGQLIKTFEFNRVQSFKGSNYPVEIVITSGTRATKTRISIGGLRDISRAETNEFKR